MSLVKGRRSKPNTVEAAVSIKEKSRANVQTVPTRFNFLAFLVESSTAVVLTGSAKFHPSLPCYFALTYRLGVLLFNIILSPLLVDGIHHHTIILEVSNTHFCSPWYPFFSFLPIGNFDILYDDGETEKGIRGTRKVWAISTNTSTLGVS